jgi:transcriptional regulator
MLTLVKGGHTMTEEEEIRIAWTIWNLIARLNDLIWDRYEDEFVKRYITIEVQEHGDSLTDKDPLSGLD